MFLRQVKVSLHPIREALRCFTVVTYPVFIFYFNIMDVLSLEKTTYGVVADLLGL